MARLSDYLDSHKRTHTHGLDATASDIRRGKSAFANGVKLVGHADIKPMSLDMNNNIFLMQNPTGISSSSYDAILPANGGVIVQSNRIKGLYRDYLTTINSNGYLSLASNYGVFAGFNQCQTLRVINQRKYEMWGMTQNAALTSNYGVRIGFNMQHFYNQFWFVELYWSGSVFTVQLYEWNTPTATTRGTVSFSSDMDWPFIWHLIIYETGDNLLITCMGYQHNNIIDNEAVTMTYSVANRPYKNSTGVIFGVRSTPGAEWLIRGCSVSDVP